MNQRLVHDAAFVTTIHLMSIIGPLLANEDERRRMFGELYAIIKAGVEGYEVQTERMQQRLRGASKN
jgi:hypothetical protein